MPLRVVPHDLPRRHSLSLSRRASMTPPRMSALHVCRVLLSDSHTTVAPCGAESMPSAKSARHPPLTQTIPLRAPHVRPSTHAVSLSCLVSVTWPRLLV